jgi:hypothetical protein
MVNSHSSTGRGSPSVATHGHVMLVEAHSVAASLSPEVPALHLITAALLLLNNTLSKGFELMANDFTGLKAALDEVVAGINSVAAAIANPAVDNNDQAVIDGLTTQLQAAAAALSAATAAEVAEDGTAPTPAPEPTVAVDGSGSTDVTP